MVYVKRFLESATAKRLPEWIRTHKVWQSTDKVKKVFPALGLSNCVEDSEHPDVPNAKVIFTSDGITGLWDIATMSMRGVLSCMHWQNPHCIHLIGSMLDPACGIIYLTDGNVTDYGLSIIKRAIVRFAMYGEKPFLLIDKIYSKTDNTNPLIYKNKDSNFEATARVFENFLRRKVTIPVYCVGRDFPSNINYDSFIPKAQVLRGIPHNQQSLVDCGIPYGDMRYLKPGSIKNKIIKLID